MSGRQGKKLLHGAPSLSSVTWCRALSLLSALAQDGGVVCFKAKRTTQFRKLMKAYCERQGKCMWSAAREAAVVYCSPPHAL